MSVITIDSWYFGDFVCEQQIPFYLVVTMNIWEHSHKLVDGEQVVRVTQRPIRHDVDFGEDI